MEDVEREKIKFEIKNRLAHVTLLNPPDNYLSHQLLAEMSETIDWLAGQSGLLGLLVSAHGPSFSLGFDYAEHSREMVFSILEKYRTICDNLLRREYPSVVLVDGKSRNWACDLLYFFDHVIAANTATFQFDHLQCGTFSPFSVLMMPERNSISATLQVFLAGAELTAAQAMDLGLVHQVVPRAELVGELKKFFGQLSTHSSSVVSLLMGNIRRRKAELFNNWADLSTTDYLNLLMDFEDYNEGIAAWCEKRPPVWKNM